MFFSLFQSESYHLLPTERRPAKSISSSSSSSRSDYPATSSLSSSSYTPISTLPSHSLNLGNDVIQSRTTPSSMINNPLPSSSRRSMNPFRKEATTAGSAGGGGSRLLKRVSRAVSGGSAGVEGNTLNSSQLSPNSGFSPSPSPELSLSPPLSPIWSPPLSPTCSFRSTSSASSRSIRRKPVQYGNLSFDSPSTSSSSTCGSEDDLIEYGEDTRGQRRSSLTSMRSIEVVDGLWTSTVDERLGNVEPLPSWCMPHSPTLESSYPSSRRFTPSIPSLAFHPFSSQSRGFAVMSTSSPSSTSSSELSPSNRFSSTPSSPTISPLRPPERKSLLRIETGGRQLILQAGGVGVSIQTDDNSDDDEEILVISMPPS